MTQISKATFNTTYADPAGTFADNTTRDISAGDMRQFAEDIKDSCLFKLDNVINKVTGTISSAQLLSIGTTPVTIISAPGANKYLLIHAISCSYKFNSVAYDFSATESPIFKFTGGTAKYLLLNTTMNSGADFHRKLNDSQAFTDKSQDLLVNTAFVLTTDDGGDATTGDGDLDVVVYYTIEDINL